MNGFLVATCAILAVASAAPSGHLGAVIAGPAGIVSGHGALGLGLGLGHGAALVAPSAAAVVSAPAAAHAVIAGPALGHGAVLGAGLGLGLGHGAIVAAPAVAGLGAITHGGGAIGVSAHGAAIRGPPTAPVVVAGPSGKIAADGLWGPTANIGLGHHGHGW